MARLSDRQLCGDEFGFMSVADRSSAGAGRRAPNVSTLPQAATPIRPPTSPPWGTALFNPKLEQPEATALIEQLRANGVFEVVGSRLQYGLPD
jgi:hypothetical protein